MRSAGMVVKWMASIWKITINPHDIKMDDISNVFVNTIMRVSTHEIFQNGKKSHLSITRRSKKSIDRALRDQVKCCCRRQWRRPPKVGRAATRVDGARC